MVEKKRASVLSLKKTSLVNSHFHLKAYGTCRCYPANLPLKAKSCSEETRFRSGALIFIGHCSLLAWRNKE